MFALRAAAGGHLVLDRGCFPSATTAGKEWRDGGKPEYSSMIPPGVFQWGDYGMDNNTKVRRAVQNMIQVGWGNHSAEEQEAVWSGSQKRKRVE